MKKRNVINLIKYHSENNYAAFRGEAYEIAKKFDASGDHQLAEYIMALMSEANTFIPQVNENDKSFLEKIAGNADPLPLPRVIEEDIIGLVNALGRGLGINKFLFQGAPGTGKTETVKQVARILNRELYIVQITSIVDSKLGQTQKNIVDLFKEINSFTQPEKVLILFDEFDSIALDRTNSNDLREMGRATSTILREMETVAEGIVLIATTNLFDYFDKAIIRRFDSVINFNRYSQDELLEIAEVLLNSFLDKFKCPGRNIRMFRKIIKQMDPIPYPGDLKNMIRTAVAFSNPNDQFDYLRRLYFTINPKQDVDLRNLQEEGFTLREIEIITGISKSQIARDLKVN